MEEHRKRFQVYFDYSRLVYRKRINSIEQLEEDLRLIEKEPFSSEELDELLLTAPELGNYVCRQCMKCLPCPQGINIPVSFSQKVAMTGRCSTEK